MDAFFEKVNAAAQKLAKNLEHGASYRETDLAVRVVGEFSAGKTRFIKELFGPLIPEKLEPVSSLEAQTLLPLEISFGEKPRLELIRRNNDWDKAEALSTLDEFPERKKLSFKPDLRLRLFLPEEKLILKEGDGYSEGNEPRLLRIIDYPGWNSEDDEKGLNSLGLSEDWRNLGLVYICAATRVENRANQKNLRLFLEAMESGFLDQSSSKTPLFFIVTYADRQECASTVEKLRKLAEDILKDRVEDFPLLILPIDFGNCEESGLRAMREAFWAHLAKNGVPAGRPDAIENIEGLDQVLPYVRQCVQWLDQLADIHKRLKSGGKYMRGREMSFFAGCKPGELGARAWRDWQKRASPELLPEAIASLTPPDLPENHFLRPWLDAYWLPRLAETQKRILYFLEELRKSLEGLKPDLTELENWLEERVGTHYKSAQISPSFAKLIALARTFPENMNKGQALCTLVSLSLLESRYADHPQ